MSSLLERLYASEGEQVLRLTTKQYDKEVAGIKNMTVTDSTKQWMQRVAEGAFITHDDSLDVLRAVLRDTDKIIVVKDELQTKESIREELDVDVDLWYGLPEHPHLKVWTRPQLQVAFHKQDWLTVNGAERLSRELIDDGRVVCNENASGGLWCMFDTVQDLVDFLPKASARLEEIRVEAQATAKAHSQTVHERFDIKSLGI